MSEANDIQRILHFGSRWPNRKGFDPDIIYRFEDETGEYELRASDIKLLANRAEVNSTTDATVDKSEAWDAATEIPPKARKEITRLRERLKEADQLIKDWTDDGIIEGAEE